MKTDINSIYPKVLFESRKPLPNLVLNLNRKKKDGLLQMDRRFFLPLATSGELLSVRQVILTGEDPLSHDFLREAVEIFSDRFERVSLWLRPGQLRNVDKDIFRRLNDLICLMGPFHEEDEARDSIESLKKETVVLRESDKNLDLRAVLYLSRATINSLPKFVAMIENSGFQKLDFFPPNLFLPEAEKRIEEPLNPSLLPYKKDLLTEEERLWDLLEEPELQTPLFDLNITRRQLLRVYTWYRAALGEGGFAPPYCRAPRLSFYIEPEGLVRCCPWQPVLGNLREESILKIAGKNHTRYFRADINLAKNRFCPACPGDYPHFLMRIRS